MDDCLAHGDLATFSVDRDEDARSLPPRLRGRVRRGPRWYEKNVLGSGPFKFADYQVGQSIRGEKNADYYHKGLPYLDGFTGIYADKQAVRVEATRSDRAAIEFRSMPPAARDELVKALGDKITVQESDWNVASAVTPTHKRKPFDDPRVRRALSLAVDRWHGAPAVSKIAIAKTVGGIVFPGSPLAATREELEQVAGFWPDIDKSRAEARRLLKEAEAEGLSFELLNRNVDQPFKYIATWLIDEWSKVGLHVSQHVVPTGPWFEAMRNGDFDVVLEAPGHGFVNPLLDVQKALPASVDSENYGNHDDPQEVDLYEKMLRRNRSVSAARVDAGVRKRCARRTEPHDLDIVVAPDRALPILCEGVQDQPHALHQSGSGTDLAR